MDRYVIFTLEDIRAQSATAGALGKRRLVSVRVHVQTLLLMLRIRQEVVCVFGMRNGCGKTLQVILLLVKSLLP